MRQQSIPVPPGCPVNAPGSFIGLSKRSWLHGAPKIRTSFGVLRNYTLFRQLVAFQKRFRLLEFPLTEIRPEFDRNASNAGMLQSGMPHLARFQEFRRVSKRRHRVDSRQSEGLKRRSPWPCRTSLLRLIFSAVGFVFSS